MMTTDEKYGVGILTSRQAVEHSVEELTASSFPMSKVALFAKEAEESDRVGEVPIRKYIDHHNLDTTGAIGNALSVGFWGSVLVGLSSLLLPGGIGAILAACAIGAALVISVAGVVASIIATNKLVKLLAGLGIPEERARRYSDRIQSCEYLLMLTGKEEEIRNAQTILQKQNIQYWDIYQPPSGSLSLEAV
jgi:hypothetical protein